MIRRMISILTVLILLAGAVPNFVSADNLTNLALNKPATSGKGSCSGSESAARAVDGDVGNGSKWCYKTGVDWLQVDLGAIYNVSEFIVTNNNEQNNYITSAYNIEISTDSITWTNVVNVTNNTEVVVQSNIAQVMARYVKLNVTTPTQDGNMIVRINEFVVNGNPTEYEIPSGSFTIAGGALAVNTATVSLALTRSGIDVIRMRFSDDGQAWSDWEEFSETKLYNMPSGDGLKMIYMELENTVGNANIDVITNSIILDTVAPDAPVLTLSSTGPTQEVTVTLGYSTDTTVKQYQISGDSLVLYTGPFVLTENKTISAYATDAAGNQKEAVFDITNIDKEAPVTTADITINSTTNYVTIHLSATDNGFDNVTSYYTVDGVQYTGDLIFLNKQGTHHITYWSIDAAGNIESLNRIEIKVEILKMNSNGQFTIEDIVKLIHQGTIQQLDMNGDSIFDKEDIQVMLKTITPIYH